jgi:type II secretory pathway pseudopilin PulG
MRGELLALLIVALLLAGAAYSGMAARTKSRDEQREDPPEEDG